MFLQHARHAFLAAACVSVLALAGPAGADSLIVNGSFEDPVVPDGSYTNFLAGSTAITGWQVVGIDSAVTSGTFTQNGVVFNAQSGKQWLDLAGVTSNSKLSGVTQSVGTLVGATYELTFYVGSANDNTFFFPTTVDLSIDGGARASYTNPTAPRNSLDWKQFTFDFTASKTLTNITFFNGSEPNNFLSGLDNVALNRLNSPTATPEPGSLAVLCLGLSALGACAAVRRRKMPVSLPKA